MSKPDIQNIKQRFEIIGSSPLLDRAIEKAMQVAPTDITVLITGESGSGKEVFPKIIHQLSARKHGAYIAVNCGAIPEGTIDSELFGHEKGSFTGAHEARKGYFEVANGGTIFLDEVAELPMPTQVRLLRVLEYGEFLKVGSSKGQKTDVRIVAASNFDMLTAINKGKFREDLYYRLSTVPIRISPLRDRKEDIHLLFRKFASDFSHKYRMPQVLVSHEALEVLVNYRWPGNIRQLKNLCEQISILEKTREISAETLKKYLPPEEMTNLPVLFRSDEQEAKLSEREILYNILFEMKRDVTELKKLLLNMLGGGSQDIDFMKKNEEVIKKLYEEVGQNIMKDNAVKIYHPAPAESVEYRDSSEVKQDELVEERSLSLLNKEKEFIMVALKKHKGRRNKAAKDLGISERTLYRKIKEYNLEEE